MKRLITYLSLSIGLFLVILPTLAFVRGFWASDETRIGWCRSDGGGMYIDDAVTIFTARPICAVVTVRTREQLTQRIEKSLGLSAEHHTNDPVGRFVIPSASLWERLGFLLEVEDEMSRSAFGPGGQGHWRASVVVPTWFVALLGATIATPPARSLWNARRRHNRSVKGLCPACAYDLRGAEHERCPECGAVVAGQSAPA